MAQYASTTEVPADRSRGEIERTLSRYGATSFAYGWDRENAMVQFEAEGRRVRFLLPMPDRTATTFTRTPTGQPRSPAQAEKAWEQATRQRWRALLLVVKAKLEAVDAGISEFEEEFLAHIVLPDGSTVGRFIRPQIERAYETGQMPSALPQLGSGD